MNFPFCKECGAEAPPGYTGSDCMPCANTGHLSRLVMSVEDAQWRLDLWSDHYDQLGYTQQQRDSIPSYRRLVAAVSGVQHATPS